MSPSESSAKRLAVTAPGSRSIAAAWSSARSASGSRSCPAEGFAAIDERDREAIALARLAGYSVAEIARALETSAPEVKRRMSRGLRSVAAGIPAAPIEPALT